MLFLTLDLHASRLTLHGLKVEVVILLLFPSVAAPAAVLEFAAVGIGLGLVLGIPESTLHAPIVFIDMGFAAEVLPVVSIHALISHVAFVLVVERTPDCLEMEKVEICVLRHLVKHINA